MFEKELNEAIIFGRYDKVLELLEKGATINQDKPIAQPLLLATSCNQTKIIELLIKHGAQIDIRCYRGNTALHEAASKGHLEAAETLLNISTEELGARNENAYTPLHVAASTNQSEMIRLFVEKGADINATDDDGATPLHIAAKYGCLAAAQSLIELDCDFSLLDNARHSAMKLAQHHNQHHIYKSIHENLANKRLSAYYFLHGCNELPFEIRYKILNFIPYLRKSIGLANSETTTLNVLEKIPARNAAAGVIQYYYREFKAKSGKKDKEKEKEVDLNISSQLKTLKLTSS